MSAVVVFSTVRLTRIFYIYIVKVFKLLLFRPVVSMKR